MVEKKDDAATDKLTLIDRILIAQKAVGVIKKDGQNAFQHYSFQSEGAIKDAVKPALIKAGLVIKFSYEIVNQYDRTTGKGGNNHFVDLMGTFTVTDGHDEMVFTIPGSGQDTGEKAMVKAGTSAQKYFYKQLFNITDTEDSDPDANDSAASTGPITKTKQPTQSNGVLDHATVKTIKDMMVQQFKALPATNKKGEPKPKTVNELAEIWIGLANAKFGSKATSVETLTPKAAAGVKNLLEIELRKLAGGERE
ncbi:ERF family protein [Lacticaseibacillus paracasei]|uniref:ERF family protein n=1 Tax=Lacticaseibacillus paracasei TaxID=1597 RepID=UPI003D790D68